MRLLTISALLAFLADQASKYVVIHLMGVGPFKSIDVFPPYLRFIYGENRGINFGLGDGVSHWILIGVAVAVCAALLWWISRRPQPAVAWASAGLLIGGALGNVVDRVLYTYVLDFINNSCCGWENPFVYNVADIFVFLGALGLIFFARDDGGKKKGT